MPVTGRGTRLKNLRYSSRMRQAIFVAALLAGCSGDRAPVGKRDAELVTNRLWVDHIPRNDRDMAQVFAAITEEPLGVFQAASQWKRQAELFRYEAHGEEFRLVFPQNGDREKVVMKASRCNEAGMDYCLEVRGASRGVKQYYSRKGWEIDSMSELQSARERSG